MDGLYAKAASLRKERRHRSAAKALREKRSFPDVAEQVAEKSSGLRGLAVQGKAPIAGWEINAADWLSPEDFLNRRHRK